MSQSRPKPVSEETFLLPNEEATAVFAARLAGEVAAPATVYLRGDLGVGKTTFTRYFLRACGVSGSVKSPTYTLLEPYQLSETMFYHFDLYRINDPWELELAGFSELFDERALRFVEWPERGEQWLPLPNLELEFSAGTGRDKDKEKDKEKDALAASEREVCVRWYADD